MLKSTSLLVGMVLLCTTVHADQIVADRQFLNDMLQADHDQHQVMQGNIFAPKPSPNALNNPFVDQLKAQQQKRLAEKQKTRPQIMMFVSFSMPEMEMKQRVADAADYGIPVILRGMVNNDMRQTATAVGRLVNDSKRGGVEIEPTLFRQFGVHTVPQLIVTCDGHTDRLSGDLSLPEALKKVAETGECAETVRQRLKKGSS